MLRLFFLLSLILIEFNNPNVIYSQFYRNNNNSIPDISLKYSPYGPLELEISGIRFKGDTAIVPALNSKRQLIYLAISCKKNKINVTSNEFIWKGWLKPKYPFEILIIKDICFKYFQN